MKNYTMILFLEFSYTKIYTSSFNLYYIHTGTCNDSCTFKMLSLTVIAAIKFTRITYTLTKL